MGAFSGQYSRRIFNEAQRYVGIHQEASYSGTPRPWVDADMNDFVMQVIRNSQRIIQRGFGDGSPDAGFQVIQAVASANNFTLNSGTGSTVEQAGRMWVGGLPAFLTGDTDYTTSIEGEAEDIHHRSTGLLATVLTDTSVRLVPGELIGRSLVPDATVPANSYLISDNTATTIAVAGGDMIADGAAPGDVYYVTLTTPAADRTDEVYLDIYLDEITPAEDTNLNHGIAAGGGTVTGANRLRAICNVVVNQNGQGHFIPTNAHTDILQRTYTDSNGESHWIVRIATLARLLGNANVLTAMVTDRREVNWGMGAVRNALVGPDHTAVDLTRRFNEVRTWITVGDGTTTFGDYNGEAGLRAANTAAPDGAGIWIKRGTYVLTAGMTVDQTTTFFGEGRDGEVVITKPAGASSFLVTATGCRFQNLRFDCSTDAIGYGIDNQAIATVVEDCDFVSIATQYGLNHSSGTRLTVKNSAFTSVSAVGGIRLEAFLPAVSTMATIDHCYFNLTANADVSDYGVVVTSAVKGRHVVIRDCEFVAARGGVFVDNDSCDHVQVEACRFGAALADYGVRVEQGNDDVAIRGCLFSVGIDTGCVLFTDTSGADQGSDGLVIDGCSFGDPDGANPWVDLENVREAVVQGCRFETTGGPAADMLFMNAPVAVPQVGSNAVLGCTFVGDATVHAAIHVGPAGFGARVIGNMIRGCTGASGRGIRIEAQSALVEGNEVHDCELGVLLDGGATEATVVSGNRVYSCDSFGIQASGGADKFIITGNHVIDNNGGGTAAQVELGGANLSVITDNYCENTGGLGIIDTGGSGSTYRGNRALIDTEEIVLFGLHEIIPKDWWLDDASVAYPDGYGTLQLPDGNDQNIEARGGNANPLAYIPLRKEIIPQLALFTALQARVTIANGVTTRLRLIQYDYVTSTRTVLATASDAVNGIEKEMGITAQDASNILFDFTANTYYIEIAGLALTVESDSNIFAVKLGFKRRR